MKTTLLIVRSVLGVIFLVFGLNGFLHLLALPPQPARADAFLGALAATGYMMPLVMGAQVLGGVMLLSGFLVPLALVLLAPVIVNIAAFHLFLAPEGLPLAVIVSALELALAWFYRDAFRPLFRQTLWRRGVIIQRTTLTMQA